MSNFWITLQTSNYDKIDLHIRHVSAIFWPANGAHATIVMSNGDTYNITAKDCLDRLATLFVKEG